MAFTKGHKGFKPKGSKSLKTEQWEMFREYCLNGGLERFQSELNKLKGKDFVIAFGNLMEYHKPKLARQEIKLESDSNLKIEVKKTVMKKNADH